MKISKYKSNIYDNGTHFLTIIFSFNQWYCTINHKMRRGQGQTKAYEDTKEGKEKVKVFVLNNFDNNLNVSFLK